MSGFVLDASVTISWCFEDEATTAMWGILERCQNEGAVVPSLWALEVGNILRQAERRGRSTSAKVAQFVELLGSLPIAIDPETARRAFAETLLLARAEGLTTYDAAYLELAMRRGLPLATKDGDLQAAAGRTGVQLLATT